MLVGVGPWNVLHRENYTNKFYTFIFIILKKECICYYLSKLYNLFLSCLYWWNVLCKFSTERFPGMNFPYIFWQSVPQFNAHVSHAYILLSNCHLHIYVLFSSSFLESVLMITVLIVFIYSIKYTNICGSNDGNIVFEYYSILRAG